MYKDGRIPGFIAFLRRMAADENRQVLAILRRGVEIPHPSGRLAYAYLAEFLSDSPQEDRWFILVAALFAEHPMEMPGASLGASFGAAARNGKLGTTGKQRFYRLLSCRSQELPRLIQQAVRILRSHGVGLDWAKLLYGLLEWDDERSSVQHRWARDFYRASTNDEKPSREDIR